MPPVLEKIEPALYTELRTEFREATKLRWQVYLGYILTIGALITLPAVTGFTLESPWTWVLPSS